VGCGAVSFLHLKGLQQNSERFLVTVAIDPDVAQAERIAKLTGTGTVVYSSLSEALEERENMRKQAGQILFEAVDIMVPHHLHYPVTMQALRAGLHVLLEKPIAPTVSECNDILEQSEKAGVMLMVAENSQYRGEVIKARELILAGDIGEIITARAVYLEKFLHDRYSSFEDKERASKWRLDKTNMGGGIAIDGSSHWIRTLRIWMGEIEEVVAITGNPLSKMEGESLVKAIFKFQSGKFATFEAILADTCFAPDPKFKITGSKGEIVIDDKGIQLFNAKNPNGTSVLDPAECGYIKSFEAEMLDFANGVVLGRKLQADAKFAVGELRTALAIYSSNEQKRWVKVWE